LYHCGEDGGGVETPSPCRVLGNETTSNGTNCRTQQWG
jgi:hypothetical protein